jgi:hypothetical protein
MLIRRGDDLKSVAVEGGEGKRSDSPTPQSATPNFSQQRGSSSSVTVVQVTYDRFQSLKSFLAILDCAPHLHSYACDARACVCMDVQLCVIFEHDCAAVTHMLRECIPVMVCMDQCVTCKCIVCVSCCVFERLYSMPLGSPLKAITAARVNGSLAPLQVGM